MTVQPVEFSIVNGEYIEVQPIRDIFSVDIVDHIDRDGEPYTASTGELTTDEDQCLSRLKGVDGVIGIWVNRSSNKMTIAVKPNKTLSVVRANVTRHVCAMISTDTMTKATRRNINH